MVNLIFISIIIPTYNRSKLLLETLQSVKKQVFKNFECIIVDDGSTDNTEEVVNKFIYEDSRFKFVKRPNDYLKGASSCRNYGFEISKGKYIQWLDDDDLISENKLELQIEKLEYLNNPNILTTCDWDFYWNGKCFVNRNILKSNFSYTALSYFQELGKNYSFCPIHTFLIPKKLILNSGNWNVHLTLNDDAEFMSRILINCEKLISTDDCYVLYRDHQEFRLSKKNNIKGLVSYLLSLRLMHANLKAHNITYKPYFKWKLFNIFYNNWKINKNILKDHKYFFKENGIDFKLANYYLLKYSIYKIIYPWYKRNFKNYQN